VFQPRAERPAGPLRRFSAPASRDRLNRHSLSLKEDFSYYRRRKCVHKNDERKERNYCYKSGNISCRYPDLLHFRSALTAPVTAAIHGIGKIVCTAERGYEQRDKNRHECLCAADDPTGFHIGAS